LILWRRAKARRCSGSSQTSPRSKKVCDRIGNLEPAGAWPGHDAGRAGQAGALEDAFAASVRRTDGVGEIRLGLGGDMGTISAVFDYTFVEPPPQGLALLRPVRTGHGWRALGGLGPSLRRARPASCWTGAGANEAIAMVSIVFRTVHLILQENRNPVPCSGSSRTGEALRLPARPLPSARWAPSARDGGHGDGALAAC